MQAKLNVNAPQRQRVYVMSSTRPQKPYGHTLPRLWVVYVLYQSSILAECKVSHGDGQWRSEEESKYRLTSLGECHLLWRFDSGAASSKKNNTLQSIDYFTPCNKTLITPPKSVSKLFSSTLSLGFCGLTSGSAEPALARMQRCRQVTRHSVC